MPDPITEAYTAYGTQAEWDIQQHKYLTSVAVQKAWDENIQKIEDARNIKIQNWRKQGGNKPRFPSLNWSDRPKLAEKPPTSPYEFYGLGRKLITVREQFLWRYGRLMDDNDEHDTEDFLIGLIEDMLKWVNL